MSIPEDETPRDTTIVSIKEWCDKHGGSAWVGATFLVGFVGLSICFLTVIFYMI